MKEAIRKYVLQNALRYGKAEPGRIMGKVLGEKPELKDTARDVMLEIKNITSEVNKMSREDIEKELKASAPEMLKKRKKEKKELPKLKNAKNVVMRFEPSPSGPMHLGHAYVLGLNSEYAKKYKAKLILRIADTNPGNIDPDSYELLPKDADWLTDNNISKVIVQSDRMNLYYTTALEMIEQGYAYICTCSAEEFRKLSQKKEECPCRKNTPDNNVKLWHKMFDTFKEGEAVMRLKTDIRHKNPAMRDFPLMRINEDKHPRQGKKYRVWPLMNLSVAVDDYDMGITHVLRAKDHADNAKRQEYIQHYMKWNVPQTQFVGRINFTDLNLSASETRKMIEQGTFTGWNDIRLPFLLALKRRGYQPGAFIKYALDVGVSLADKKVDKNEFFKALNAFNKEIIDPVSSRYFFVEDPVGIDIEGAPEQNLVLDLHPDNKKGGRNFKTETKFFIAKKDFGSFKDGELIRLMDCLNFTKKGDKFIFDSLEYKKFRKQGKKIIHWLAGETVDVEVMMDDGSVKKGLAESGIKKLNKGDIVQFERFGFVRLDEDTPDKMVFWWAHR